MRTENEKITRRSVFSVLGLGLAAAGISGTLLSTSAAEAQTAGMERRQDRREGRRERREGRREGRQDRREGRRNAREDRREGRQQARDVRRGTGQ
jgi:hypothetical protein